MIRLLIHGQLIIDDYRQYEDGALLIDDKHILDVYINSNKLNDVYYDEVVDLNNKIVMPRFYDADLLSSKQVVVDPLDVKIESNKAIMLGNSKAYSRDVKIDYDGYYDLFNNMTGFDISNFGLVNRAFDDYDKYVEVNYSQDNNDDYVKGHKDALGKYYGAAKSNSKDLCIVEGQVNDELKNRGRASASDMYARGYYDGLEYVSKALVTSKNLISKKMYQKLLSELS